MSPTYICVVINSNLHRGICFVTVSLWLGMLSCGKSSCFINHFCPSATCRKWGLKKLAGVAFFQHPELVMQGHISSYQRFLLTLGLHSKVRSYGLRGTPVRSSKVSPRSSPQGQGFSRKDFTCWILWVHCEFAAQISIGSHYYFW